MVKIAYVTSVIMQLSSMGLLGVEGAKVLSAQFDDLFNTRCRCAQFIISVRTQVARVDLSRQIDGQKCFNIDTHS